MRRGKGSIFGMTLAALVATTAHAQDPPREKYGTVELFPFVAAPLNQEFDKAPLIFLRMLTDALQEEAKIVVANSTVADTAVMFGCDPTRLGCLETLTSILRVDMLIFGTITRGEGDVTLIVEITRFTLDEGRRRTTHEFGSRQMNALADEFSAVVADLLGLASQPPTEVTVAPAPKLPGARASPSFALRHVKPYTWGLAGAAVASVTVGSVLMGAAGGVRKDIVVAPRATVGDLERLAALELRGESLTRKGTGLLFLGGAVLAGAGVLAVLQGTAVTTLPERSADSVDVTVWAGPAGGGLVVTVPLD